MHQDATVTPTSARPSVAVLVLGVMIAAVVFAAAVAVLTLSFAIFTLLAMILDAQTVVITIAALAAVSAFLAVIERERRRSARYAQRRRRIEFERTIRAVQIEDLEPVGDVAQDPAST